MFLSVLKWEYYQHTVLFSLEHVNVVMRLTLIIIALGTGLQRYFKDCVE